MKNWRRATAVILALMLVMVCFVGCGNGGGEDGEDPYASYPDKTIEFIVPYAAGGGTDAMARAVAKNLSESLGVSCVVTNIEGASGAIGSMEAFNKAPDGYTILVHQYEAMIAYYLGGVYSEPLHEEMEMVATVVYDPNVVSVPKNSKFKTFDDVVAYAKENPGKLTWASTGSKSSNEQGSAEIWEAYGIEVNYVPYDSASKSRTAVLGGHADVLYSQVSEVKALVDSGDMAPIGVSSEERSLFEDCPTFVEMGYDVVNGLHRGFFAPPETPAEIVEKLETAIAESCKDEAFISLMENDLGYSVEFVGSDELEAMIAERLPIQEKLWELIQED